MPWLSLTPLPYVFLVQPGLPYSRPRVNLTGLFFFFFFISHAPEKPKKEGSSPKEDTEDKWAVERDKDQKGAWGAPMGQHLVY